MKAKAMTRVLSISQVFDGPLERQAFGSIVLKVFELVVQTGVVPLLSKRLTALLEPRIQVRMAASAHACCLP